MTEKEALLWVLGILGSLCAAAITIDKVLEIIRYRKVRREDCERLEDHRNPTPSKASRIYVVQSSLPAVRKNR